VQGFAGILEDRSGSDRGFQITFCAARQHTFHIPGPAVLAASKLGDSGVHRK
jgi:hypothetical protein